jgi:hypothetical protein
MDITDPKNFPLLDGGMIKQTGLSYMEKASFWVLHPLASFSTNVEILLAVLVSSVSVLITFNLKDTVKLFLYTCNLYEVL